MPDTYYKLERYGEVLVEYKILSAEPDVGLMGRGVEDICVYDISNGKKPIQDLTDIEDAAIERFLIDIVNDPYGDDEN